jgi:di/tricarboxylate transporter
MGEVLQQTNALHALTTFMFAWMGPWVTNRFSLAFVPYWTAFVYHIFLGNEISMLATSLPPLMNFAITHGIHPLPLGLIWTFAGGGKIFVYQSGVMVTGYSYGYFESKDLLRVGFCLTVVESLVLLVIVPFYWPLLGIR